VPGLAELPGGHLRAEKKKIPQMGATVLDARAHLVPFPFLFSGSP
jgi:hypothetical protein